MGVKAWMGTNFNQTFDGKLKDFFIYNRALTNTEIEQMYKHKKTIYGY